MAYFNNYQNPWFNGYTANSNMLQPNSPKSNIDIIEIQGGEPVAYGTIVEPGKTKWMIDSSESTIYIKSVDNNGMPLPLRILNYTEKIPMANQKEDIYVTKDGLEELVSEIVDRKLKGDADV